MNMEQNPSQEQPDSTDMGLYSIPPTERVEAVYDAQQIQVLEGLEAVRRRPAMYIGGTDARGMHHLFVEVTDNAIDEAMAGYCDRIVVTLHADDSLSVLDNGRGIPVDINQQTGLPGVELALTRLHAGGKFDSGSYKVSGGLHGVGVSCVNACSEWMTVDVWRDGHHYRIGFERGITTTPLTDLGPADDMASGTLVRWKPDPQIFGDIKHDPERITRRMRELAYLNRDVTLVFRNERDGTPEEVFHYERGLEAFVEHLNENKETLHPPIYFGGSRDNVVVEVAMQYNDGYQEAVLCFANMINTPDGGTHLSGFRSADTGHQRLRSQAGNPQGQGRQPYRRRCA